MNIKFIWSIYIFKYNLLIQIKHGLFIICYSKSNKLSIPSYYLQVTAKRIRKVENVKEMIPKKKFEWKKNSLSLQNVQLHSKSLSLSFALEKLAHLTYL